MPQKRYDLIAFMKHPSIFMLGAAKIFATSWTLKHIEKKAQGDKTEIILFKVIKESF